MKNVAVFASALTLALVAGSCRQDNRSAPFVAAQSSQEPASDVLTLSSSQLMFLDWDGPYASHAKVVKRRIVGDSAAEFDIHFPSNRPGHRSIEFVSSGVGGRGRLIGRDVSDYKTFALKFTLISINGTAGSDTTLKLAAGALIGPTIDGKVSGSTPVTLGTSERLTAISRTPVGKSRIYHIGVRAYMLEPENWDPAGSTVTIRVEPVQNATIPAWQ